MKTVVRKFLLRFVIASLSITALLGIISVLWPRLGESGLKILATVAGIDAASILALCCTGPAKSALHRAVQVTGILSAGISLAAGLYLLWLDTAANDRTEVIQRASAVFIILAVASAHTCLVLPLNSHTRPSRAVISGTVFCTAAAAELIANYALLPHFDPGSGYLRALTVLLILDALGTIVTLLMYRFTPRRADATPTHSPHPAPGPCDAPQPAVPGDPSHSTSAPLGPSGSTKALLARNMCA